MDEQEKNYEYVITELESLKENLTALESNIKTTYATIESMTKGDSATAGLLNTNTERLMEAIVSAKESSLSVVKLSSKVASIAKDVESLKGYSVPSKYTIQNYDGFVYYYNKSAIDAMLLEYKKEIQSDMQLLQQKIDNVTG